MSLFKPSNLTPNFESVVYNQPLTLTFQVNSNGSKVTAYRVQILTDFNDKDDKGRLIFTPQAITATIKQIPQLSKELKDAEQAVAKEIEEQGRARGGNESKSLMDDGILM